MSHFVTLWLSCAHEDHSTDKYLQLCQITGSMLQKCRKERLPKIFSIRSQNAELKNLPTTVQFIFTFGTISNTITNSYTVNACSILTYHLVITTTTRRNIWNKVTCRYSNQQAKNKKKNTTQNGKMLKIIPTSVKKMFYVTLEAKNFFKQRMVLKYDSELKQTLKMKTSNN